MASWNELTALWSVLLQKLAIASIILLSGIILARVFGKILERILHELEVDRITASKGLTFSLEKVLGKGLEVLLYLATMIFFFWYLGASQLILFVISGAIIILVFISFFFALHYTVPNFLVGVYMRQRRLFKKGDHVRYTNVEGVVEHITFSEVGIRTKEGDLLVVPSTLLLNKGIMVKRMA